MKYLILIPFFLFSQTPDYPDTLYLKSGKVYPCIISQIAESHIIFVYGEGRETTLSPRIVDKIILRSIGEIYSQEKGFTEEILNILDNTGNIDININTHDSPSFKSSKKVMKKNIYLILSNGDVISELGFQKLLKNFILVYQSGKTILVSVESVVALNISDKSEFWENAGMGALAGVVAGALIYAPFTSDDMLAVGPKLEEALIGGGIAGFLIGGIIGSSGGEDEIYDLTYLTPKRKLKKIREEISKQLQ